MWLQAQETTPDEISAPVETQTGGIVTILQLQGAIGPATADFIVRGVETAEENGSALMVIEMDTWRA